jgi:hypothetical protein
MDQGSVQRPAAWLVTVEPPRVGAGENLHGVHDWNVGTKPAQVAAELSQAADVPGGDRLCAG